jgi:hypothetical protein
MSDIFSCIFYDITLYFELFILIFNGNLCHYNRNYFRTTAYEITTSFITVKLRHPKRDTVQHATHLAPPMPDEISGMGNTNGNASLICKKFCSGTLYYVYVNYLLVGKTKNNATNLSG